jgi:hypothetical protein
MAATRASEDYRARAAEFERLADETSNPDSREILLTIAERWTALAEDAEPVALLAPSADRRNRALN